MAAFAKGTFDAANYLAHRPIYPKKMFDKILSAHKNQGGSMRSLLDVGSGPGMVAKDVGTHFERIVAVDPSQNMIQVANDHLSSLKSLGKKVECKVGNAEKLDFLADNSIDLIIAGQAAHWFKFPEVWDELYRVLDHKGTVAFISYSDHFYVGEEKISKMQYDFTHGKLGPYWEQPGRGRVEDLLTTIDFPTSKGWHGAVRLGFDPHPFVHYDSHEFAKPNDEELPLLHKKMTKNLTEKYLSTWSASNNYRNAHPEDEKFLDDFFKELWEVRAKEKKAKGEEDSDEIVVAWPSAITMIHKD